MKRVCVVGLGKIGLSLAAQFASAGFDVIGCDINSNVVAAVNAGLCPDRIVGEPGLDQKLSQSVQAGRLRATSDTTAAVHGSQVVVVIVPVVITSDKEVDYAFMNSAIEAIGRGLQPGTLVIVETTVAVGDTRRFGLKLSEVSGLQVGVDFYLAFSPERVQSNRIFADLQSYPKIVGGFNVRSGEAAAAFYSEALGCKVWQASNCETAEFAKIAECVYRDVNIALANELAKYAEVKGVDFVEMARLANSEPLSHLHQPGVGVGGHCIPVYPYLFIRNGLEDGLTTLARSINDDMGSYTAEMVDRIAGPIQGRRVVIMGLAFRGNVKETFLSSAFKLYQAFEERGCMVSVFDPLYSPEEMEQHGINYAESPVGAEIIVLQAYHQAFKEIDWTKLGAAVIVDGRNMLDQRAIELAGITYVGIGRPVKALWE